ncbi:hypothetical protein ACH5RR_005751 [Cinchona calisaya]|uniref:Uncharacterized protein n=1 Tax=Cinchona calisaya TaxID=153742 RepID=A0ABD3AM34_9GENT
MKMCATAVLRSQNCLRKPYLNSSPSNPNCDNVSRSRRLRRRSHTFVNSNQNRNSNPDYRKSAAAANKNVLVMGQVKILKRGEQLPDLIINKQQRAEGVSETATFDKLGFGGKDDLILCSTGRLGPEPELVHKEIRASDFYAGSGPIVASPPPSSLPFPAFFSKKEKKIDEATSDLLRLLRLDLQ